MKYPGDLPSTDVVRRLTAAGVVTRSGAEYGPSGEGHVRISFATSLDDLDEGLARMAEVFATF